MECDGRNIEETPALIALVEGCNDDAQTTAIQALTTVATELVAAGKASADGPDAICFYAKTTEGVVGNFREATELETPSDKPTLLLVDIPDQSFYVTEKDGLDAATIREFLASWKSGALKSAGERKQLARLVLHHAVGDDSKQTTLLSREPTDGRDDQKPAALPEGWQLFQDIDGREFYYCEATGETSYPTEE